MILEALAGGGAARSVLMALIAAVSLSLARGPGAGAAATVEPAVAEQRERSEPASAPAATPPQVDPAEAYCLERFLQPFRAIKAPEPLQVATEPRASGAPTSEPRLSGFELSATLRQLPVSHELRAQVVTIADPIDSGLAYQFDTQLHAIRLGFEQPLGGEAYHRDRSWLPWDDRGVADEKQQAASRECRRSTPGVLLFRGDDRDPKPWLAVLVVGETPTSGVHALAMQNALDVAATLEGAGEHAQYRLEITGPTFSGSVPSLKRALQDWAQARPLPAFEINVRTASATGPSVAAELKGSTEDWLPRHHVSFSATTPPEVAVQCAYLSYLRWRLGVGSRGEDRLQEVALLHESGTVFGSNLTPDGRSEEENHCKLEAGLHLSFPVNVSALREAYEADERRGAASAELIGRRTQLPVSLHAKLPLEIDAEPSARTTFAADVALTNVLGTISRASVRHVGIQATDIGDAIFLARKIRDVAPDVRIAFFTSDVLLLHSAFARDLDGSLVVTPYPFLGTNYLDTDAADASLEAGAPAKSEASDGTGRPRARVVREHPGVQQNQGFESATSLATFNAVLASRGASVDQLLEYRIRWPAPVGKSWYEVATSWIQGAPSSASTTEQELLPIWISALGGGRLVPLAVSPSRDEDKTIYSTPQTAAPICLERPGEQLGPGRGSYRERRHALRDSQLEAAKTAKIPRLWHVVFALLALGWLADWSLRRRALGTLSRTPAPVQLCAEYDHRADLAMSRTKWRLYGWIRSVVLAGAVLYMGTLYFFSNRVYSARELPVALELAIAAVVVGVALTARRAYAAFRRDYRDLTLRTVPRWQFPWPTRPAGRGAHAGSVGAAAAGRQAYRHGEGLWDGVVQLLGFARPLNRRLAARTSVAQLRVLLVLCWTLLVLFAVGQFLAVPAAEDIEGWSLGTQLERASPAITLWVLRSLAIVGAASPAAPTLLCASIVYLWAVGRMARLRLMHGLCRVAPPQAVLELVSTPLRAVLYPATPGTPSTPARDEGFARVERRVVNAVLRPITGPQYVAALAVFAFLPLVPFVLKPPSTLEQGAGNTLLAAALALGALLIGSTLIQLVQYWLALERMLKRIVVHPLGSCFTRVDPLVRGSADEQLSRTPSEVLRLGACQARFEQLVSEGHGLWPPELLARLERHRRVLLESRHGALTAATERPLAEAAWREAKLGRAVIVAASDVTALLMRAWDGTLQGAPAARSAAAASAEGAALATRDALAARAAHFDDAQLSWLRRAEELVATVTAFLINRHVRQLPLFVSTLITSVLLLMLATQSYPFEPHRLMLTCIWALAGAVVATALWVYFSVQRNALLSEIAGTLPGKVTWDGALITRVLKWGIIPLLGVAALQYPDMANALLRVAEPFTRALN